MRPRRCRCQCCRREEKDRLLHTARLWCKAIGDGVAFSEVVVYLRGLWGQCEAALGVAAEGSPASSAISR